MYVCVRECVYACVKECVCACEVCVCVCVNVHACTSSSAPRFLCSEASYRAPSAACRERVYVCV